MTFIVSGDRWEEGPESLKNIEQGVDLWKRLEQTGFGFCWLLRLLCPVFGNRGFYPLVLGQDKSTPDKSHVL